MRRVTGPPTWRGRVALTVAAFVAGGWAAALVWQASPATPPLDDTSAALLSTVGGVLAGGVAAYLGSRDSGGSDPPDTPSDKPET